MTNNKQENSALSHMTSSQNTNISNLNKISPNPIHYAIFESDPDLQNLRNQIIKLTKEKKECLVYLNKQNGEHIFLNGGTLIGYMNGRYFCCWCYLPKCQLFFKEAKNLNKLTNASDMNARRIKILFQELDDRFSKEPSAQYLRRQMQSVQKIWNLIQQTKEANFSNTSFNPKQQNTVSEHSQNISPQRVEAEAAKQRRLENEERVRKRKAQQEAEKLKRKKIEATTKRINADAAKAIAERKAEEERKAQMQKEKQLHAQAEEMKKAEENMMLNFNRHPELPPIFEYDKNSSPCFYLKIKGKIIHIIMHPQKPKCQMLTPTSTKFLDIHTFMDVHDRIEQTLNSQEKIEPFLEILPTFYKQCMDINHEREKAEKSKKTIIIPPQSVTCETKDAPALYKKICTRLMTPYANPHNHPDTSNERTN